MSLWIPIRTKYLCDHYDAATEIWCVKKATWERAREPGEKGRPKLSCDEHLVKDAEKEMEEALDS